MIEHKIEELKLENLEETIMYVVFVLEEYQQNGIARALYNLVIRNCKNANTKRITVNSSPYAHNVYLKLGFIDDNQMQEVDGIKFYPMHREI